MQFITLVEVACWLMEQYQLWDDEDMALSFRHLPSLHSYLNSQEYFQLDTIEGDKHIEQWLESERILTRVFC